MHLSTQRSIAYLLLYFLVPSAVGAQTVPTFFIATEKQDRPRSTYWRMAIGGKQSGFRDFATSPLFYQGNLTAISVSHIDIDEARESSLGVSYAFGQHTSDFNDHNASSKVKIIALNYLELFELRAISSNKINLKVGGQFNSTFNIRNNSSLFNNSKGIELMANLFASAKVAVDISRQKDRTIKFLGAKFKLKKQRRILAYNLNVGLVNSAFRNGFVYTGHAAILNTDDFFEGYQFRVFTGYRINSRLDYTVFLPNKNGFQFSYLWDVYSTGQEDSFEMYQHTFTFSFLYNIK